MIDNYDDKTIDETLEAVSDFDADEVKEFLRFERDNKNRTGVIDPLLADIPATEDEVFGTDGGESAAGDESSIADTDDGDDTADGPDLDPDVVTVVSNAEGYVGGLWFDDAGDEQTTKLTTRVQQAVDDGLLTVIERH